MNGTDPLVIAATAIITGLVVGFTISWFQYKRETRRIFKTKQLEILMKIYAALAELNLTQPVIGKRSGEKGDIPVAYLSFERLLNWHRSVSLLVEQYEWMLGHFAPALKSLTALVAEDIEKIANIENQEQEVSRLGLKRRGEIRKLMELIHTAMTIFAEVHYKNKRILYAGRETDMERLEQYVAKYIRPCWWRRRFCKTESLEIS